MMPPTPSRQPTATGASPTKHQTPQRKDELSFGIELEFLFYFLAPHAGPQPYPDYDPQPRPVTVTLDPAEDARLPPALTLPAGYTLEEPPWESREPATPTAREWAAGLVEQAILAVPGARVASQPVPAGAPASSHAMHVFPRPSDAHGAWDVGQDSSVDELEVHIAGYRYVGLEVRSPALWDRPESHQHIYRVVRELTRRFRLRVNLRTGLHVHVGAGTERVADTDTAAVDDDDTPARARKHALDTLKRAAALMWAADGLLHHAHPPERALGEYAPPLRHCSRLAHGCRTVRVDVGYGEYRREEVPLLTQPFGPSVAARGAAPAPALPSDGFPRVDGARRFPAARAHAAAAAAAADDARARFRSMARGAAAAIDARRPAGPAVRSADAGVAAVMRCLNRAEVANLFQPPNEALWGSRLNYNLRGYLGGDFERASDRTGTVEFREAAGSVSADWVSTWCGICVGIFRFARDAPPPRYWAVIGKLSEAEAEAAAQSDGSGERQQGYDMISLLFDMGLFAEGLFLEKKLRADPMAFWYPNRLVYGTGQGEPSGPRKQDKYPYDYEQQDQWRLEEMSFGTVHSEDESYDDASSSDGWPYCPDDLYAHYEPGWFKKHGLTAASGRVSGVGSDGDQELLVPPVSPPGPWLTTARRHTIR